MNFIKPIIALSFVPFSIVIGFAISGEKCELNKSYHLRPLSEANFDLSEYGFVENNKETNLFKATGIATKNPLFSQADSNEKRGIGVRDALEGDSCRSSSPLGIACRIHVKHEKYSELSISCGACARLRKEMPFGQLQPCTSCHDEGRFR